MLKHKIIIGGPGSGKTTLLKKYVDDTEILDMCTVESSETVLGLSKKTVEFFKTLSDDAIPYCTIEAVITDDRQYFINESSRSIRRIINIIDHILKDHDVDNVGLMYPESGIHPNMFSVIADALNTSSNTVYIVTNSTAVSGMRGIKVTNIIVCEKMGSEYMVNNLPEYSVVEGWIMGNIF